MNVTTRVRATLDAMEMHRQACLARLRQRLCISLSAGAVAALALSLAGLRTEAPYVMLMGFAGAVTIALRALRRLSAELRGRLMPELLLDLNPSLKHRADGYVDQREFSRAGLWRDPDVYSGQDLVEGHIGDTHIRFSLVNAQERHETTERDSQGNTRTVVEYRTLFQGIFLSADFNKHFSSRITVSAGAPGLLRRLFAAHVAMEDPRFNAGFTVGSNDQIEARYVLTPALVARLLELRDRLGNFELSFVDGRMIIALDRPVNVFDFNVWRRCTDRREAPRILRELQSIIAIVEDLDLNTRIWSKAANSDQPSCETHSLCLHPAARRASY